MSNVIRSGFYFVSFLKENLNFEVTLGIVSVLQWRGEISLIWNVENVKVQNHFLKILFFFFIVLSRGNQGATVVSHLVRLFPLFILFLCMYDAFKRPFQTVCVCDHCVKRRTRVLRRVSTSKDNGTVPGKHRASEDIVPIYWHLSRGFSDRSS